MSNMMEMLDAAETIFKDNLTINHSSKTMMQHFVAEDYPAICLEPGTSQAQLDQGLAFNYDDSGAITVYYVEEAPEDRDMTAFIDQIDSIVDMLKEYPQLDGVLNTGIEIQAKYMERQQTDNIEFIAQIVIKGRDV